MAGVGTKILAIDYNDIQLKVARVLGKTPTSDGDYGYGQAVASKQVSTDSATATDNIITVEQWNNLRTDLIKAREHQTGVSQANTLGAAIDNAQTVKDSTRAAYLSLANQIVTDRLVTPPSGAGVALPQAEEIDAYSPQKVRNTAWNGQVESTVTITFASGDDARYFFNAGGEIRFTAQRLGGTLAKDLNWSTLLSDMKQIRFNHTSCTSPDPDTSTSINTNTGYYDLGTQFVTVYTKKGGTGGATAGGTSYASNYFTILARVTTADKYQLQFVLRFVDADAAKLPTAGSQSPWHIDEDVTGDLKTFVTILRPRALGGVTLPIPGGEATSIA